MILRIVKNDILISSFHSYEFDKLFNNDAVLFLSWLFTESGHDQYCVRYEPGYRWINNNKFDDFKERLSYGLFQIMGANLFPEGFDDSKIENFLSDISFQFYHARQFIKKCPSINLTENLRWWNTGSTSPSAAGDLYILRIEKNKTLFIKT